MIKILRVLAPTAVLTLLLALPGNAAPLSFPVPPFPVLPQGGPAPSISAPSWILFDEATDSVLAWSNPRSQRAMASITKIMTGMIALENTGRDDLVTISRRAAETGEKEIDLVAGETVTMDALLKSLIIHSANDSATAIAEHIGGSVEGFVAMMNDRAAQLGMTDTSFANPHGLDAPGHYSSARDMLILVRIAMADRYFVDIARSTIVVMPPAPDGTERIGTTTNLMLSGGDSRPGFPAVDQYDGTIGVKTGFTTEALLTFVASAERAGRRLYVVILGSDEPRAHFFEAEQLFDYGFDFYPYNGPVALGTPYVATKARIEPDPLLVQGDIESYVHLAGQGLMREEPAPMIENGARQPVPLPVVEVSRQSDRGPESVIDTITFWLDQLLGS